MGAPIRTGSRAGLRSRLDWWDYVAVPKDPRKPFRLLRGGPPAAREAVEREVARERAEHR
jgi:hypothetical protein